MPARGLVRQVCLENGLIFRRERGLLSAARRLARVKCRLAAGSGDDRPGPLALEVWILRVIERLGFRDGHAQRGQRHGTDEVSVEHAVLPAIDLRTARALSSLTRWIEISQIRRLLALSGGHQVAIGAQKIVFLADGDMIVVFIAIVFVPNRIFLAPDWLCRGKSSL